MLNELHDRQESGETVWAVSMSFDVESRTTEDGDIVHKTFTFSYADEWDKWVFQEYEERRAPEAQDVADRQWIEARHVTWNDPNETPTIDVPPEVADKLAEATGADSVTIQTPTGGIRESEYEEVYEV